MEPPCAHTSARFGWVPSAISSTQILRRLSVSLRAHSPRHAIRMHDRGQRSISLVQRDSPISQVPDSTARPVKACACTHGMHTCTCTARTYAAAHTLVRSFACSLAATRSPALAPSHGCTLVLTVPHILSRAKRRMRTRDRVLAGMRARSLAVLCAHSCVCNGRALMLVRLMLTR